MWSVTPAGECAPIRTTHSMRCRGLDGDGVAVERLQQRFRRLTLSGNEAAGAPARAGLTLADFRCMWREIFPQLSVSERHWACTEQVFNEMDADGSGEITWGEIVAYLAESQRAVLARKAPRTPLAVIHRIVAHSAAQYDDAGSWQHYAQRVYSWAAAAVATVSYAVVVAESLPAEYDDSAAAAAGNGSSTDYRPALVGATSGAAFAMDTACSLFFLVDLILFAASFPSEAPPLAPAAPPPAPAPTPAPVVHANPLPAFGSYQFPDAGAASDGGAASADGGGAVSPLSVQLDVPSPSDGMLTPSRLSLSSRSPSVSGTDAGGGAGGLAPRDSVGCPVIILPHADAQSVPNSAAPSPVHMKHHGSLEALQPRSTAPPPGRRARARALAASGTVWLSVALLAPWVAAHGYRWASGEAVGEEAGRLLFLMKSVRVVKLLVLVVPARCVGFSSQRSILCKSAADLAYLLIVILVVAAIAACFAFFLETGDATFDVAAGAWVRRPGSSLADAGKAIPFQSVPDAVWWGLVTLCTVGYGDVVPHTYAGRGVAAFLMFVGLVVVSSLFSTLSMSFSAIDAERQALKARHEACRAFYLGVKRWIGEDADADGASPSPTAPTPPRKRRITVDEDELARVLEAHERAVEEKLHAVGRRLAALEAENRRLLAELSGGGPRTPPECGRERDIGNRPLLSGGP